MNKVFSANQRKDKDLSSGCYTNPEQEPVPSSATPKSAGPLIAGCVVLLGIVLLLVLIL